MRWRNAVASVASLTIFATESFAAERFACAAYFAATPAGQKKAEAGVKGTLIFDQNSKKVEFLNPNGTPAFSINSDEIHAMQYEKTTQPRYDSMRLLLTGLVSIHQKTRLPETHRT